MSITPEKIKDIVVNESDFGHEMRVGSILGNRNLGYASSCYEPTTFYPPDHGGTYKDPVTGKPRQFDFRLQVTRGWPTTPKFRIWMAVECKNLNPSHPLVICGRPRTTEESYNVFVVRPDKNTAQLKQHAGRGSYYKPNEFVGKDLLRLKDKAGKLHADNDSEIYDKWAQALASSHELVNQAVNAYTTERFTTFVMPLVVVPDEALWSVDYDAKGQPGDPTKVNQCAFYVGHPLDIGTRFVLTHIHFATCAGLVEMLAGFNANDGRVWDEIFNPMAATNYEP